MKSSHSVLFVFSISIVFLFSVDRINFADAISYNCPQTIGSYTFDGEPTIYESSFDCKFYYDDNQKYTSGYSAYFGASWYTVNESYRYDCSWGTIERGDHFEIYSSTHSAVVSYDKPEFESVARDLLSLVERENVAAPCAGAEADSDNDGLRDDEDSCPNDPEDHLGADDGCPEKDFDKDTFYDSVDSCVYDAEDYIGDLDGCPEKGFLDIDVSEFETIKQDETAEVAVTVKSGRLDNLVTLTATNWSTADISTYFDSSQVEPNSYATLYVKTTCKTPPDKYLISVRGETEGTFETSEDRVLVTVEKNQKCQGTATSSTQPSIVSPPSPVKPQEFEPSERMLDKIEKMKEEGVIGKKLNEREVKIDDKTKAEVKQATLEEFAKAAELDPRYYAVKYERAKAGGAIYEPKPDLGPLPTSSPPSDLPPLPTEVATVAKISSEYGFDFVAVYDDEGNHRIVAEGEALRNGDKIMTASQSVTISFYDASKANVVVGPNGEYVVGSMLQEAKDIGTKVISVIKGAIRFLDRGSGTSALILTPTTAAKTLGTDVIVQYDNVTRQTTIHVSEGNVFAISDFSTDGEIIQERETGTIDVDGNVEFTTLTEDEWSKISKAYAVPEEETTTPSQESGGCLIATATYGSELAPQVQFLREIRDNTLLKTSSGSAFMNAFNSFYYSFSPTVAEWERQNPVFKEAVKITITPLITSLSILNYVDIDSEADILFYGISIILLNIGIYFVAPTFVINRLKQCKN